MKKALWLEVVGESPALSSPELLEKACGFVESHDISEVYLQVARSGKCWYDTKVADQTPFSQVQAVHPAFCPVSQFLAWASKRDVKVHAWINVFNLGEDYSRETFEQFSSGSLQQDNRGKSVASYLDRADSTYALDAPGVWLDPASSQVRSYVHSLVEELVEKFPALSGVHLDFFRYPYLLPIRPSSGVSVGYDFGYSPEAVESFLNEHPGVLIQDKNGCFQLQSYSGAIRWDSWRRELLRGYLKDVRGLLGEKQQLTVAVIPWSDRAYLSSYQDWRGWLSQGDVDGVHLMSYTLDTTMFRYLLRQAVAFQSKNAKVFAGIGAYLFSSVEEFYKQLAIAEEEGVSGVTLFSYRNLVKKKWALPKASAL